MEDTTGLQRFRTKLNLKVRPCQIKAYRNLIQKFQRTVFATSSWRGSLRKAGQSQR